MSEHDCLFVLRRVFTIGWSAVLPQWTVSRWLQLPRRNRKAPEFRRNLVLTWGLSLSAVILITQFGSAMVVYSLYWRRRTFSWAPLNKSAVWHSRIDSGSNPFLVRVKHLASSAPFQLINLAFGLMKTLILITRDIICGHTFWKCQIISSVSLAIAYSSAGSHNQPHKQASTSCMALLRLFKQKYFLWFDTFFRV